MRRNQWIRERLENWAKWVVEMANGSRGYPTQTTFARLAPDKLSTESREYPLEEDARQVNDALDVLRLSAPHLWLAINCRYIGDPRLRQRKRRPLHIAEIGRALCQSESAVKKHLADAELQLGILLNRGQERHEMSLPGVLR